MQVTRQEKVARLLQKELGELFLLFARRHQGVIVTATEVRVTADMSLARVFVSVFPVSRQADLMAAIEANAKNFRYELGNRVRHQLRIVPELEFRLDESMDKLEHIDELLKQ